MNKLKKTLFTYTSLVLVFIIILIFAIVKPFVLINDSNSFLVVFTHDNDNFFEIGEYIFSMDKPKIVCSTNGLNDKYHVYYSGDYAELDKDCWEFKIHYKNKEWKIKEGQKIMLDDYLQTEMSVGQIIYNTIEKNKDVYSVSCVFRFVNTDFINTKIVEETKYVELGNGINYEIIVDNNYGSFDGGLYVTQQNLFGNIIQQEIRQTLIKGDNKFVVSILPGELGVLKVDFVPFLEVGGTKIIISDAIVHTETQVVAVGTRFVDEESKEVPSLVVPDVEEEKSFLEKIIDWFTKLVKGEL